MPARQTWHAQVFLELVPLALPFLHQLEVRAATLCPPMLPPLTEWLRLPLCHLQVRRECEAPLRHTQLKTRKLGQAAFLSKVQALARQ